MMDPELNNALQQLQTEIDNMDDVDELTRDKMLGLKANINQAIEDSNQHSALRERLEDAVSHLEADHPNLAAAISTVVNILSNLGV